jgi:predicted dehydrogenase
MITCAGYMNRYRKGINTAREMFKSDPPVIVHGGWIGGTPKPGPSYSILHWWVQKDKSGGQFLEQVTHTVDLLRYLCGEASEVFAYGAKGFTKGVTNYTIDDAAVVNIRLKSGGVANLMAGTASNADGGVWLNCYGMRSAARFTGWEHNAVIKRADDPLTETTIKGEPDIFAVEDRAFLDAVLSGDRSGIRSSFPDAVKTLEISVAANESIASGKPVAIKG